jgi:hypothetical protein
LQKFIPSMQLAKIIGTIVVLVTVAAVSFIVGSKLYASRENQSGSPTGHRPPLNSNNESQKFYTYEEIPARSDHPFSSSSQFPSESPKKPAPSDADIFYSNLKASLLKSPDKFLKEFAKNPIHFKEENVKELSHKLWNDHIISNQPCLDEDKNFKFLIQFNKLREKLEQNTPFTQKDIRLLVKVEPTIIAYNIPFDLSKTHNCVKDYVDSPTTVLKFEYGLDEMFENIVNSKSEEYPKILYKYKKDLLSFRYLFSKTKSQIPASFTDYQRECLESFFSSAWIAAIVKKYIEKARHDDSDSIPIEDKNFVKNVNLNLTKYKVSDFPEYDLEKFVKKSEVDFTKLSSLPTKSEAAIQSLFVKIEGHFSSSTSDFLFAILKELDLRNISSSSSLFHSFG